MAATFDDDDDGRLQQRGLMMVWVVKCLLLVADSVDVDFDALANLTQPRATDFFVFLCPYYY